MPDSIVIRKLKQAVIRYGSQKAVAKVLGISEQYLSEVLAGRKEPGPMILKGLGYERVVKYKEIEP